MSPRDIGVQRNAVRWGEADQEAADEPADE